MMLVDLGPAPTKEKKTGLIDLGPAPTPIMEALKAVEPSMEDIDTYRRMGVKEYRSPSGKLYDLTKTDIQPEPDLSGIDFSRLGPAPDVEIPPMVADPSGLTLTERKPLTETVEYEPEYKPEVQAGSLLKRFGKKLTNAFARVGENIISSPFSPVGLSREQIRPYEEQAHRELIRSGFDGSPAQAFRLIESRAAQLAAAEKVPKFKVEPAKDTSEKIVDVAAGLTAFLSQLALTRKVLPKGTSEPIVWEVQNQLSGGIPGQGAAMASAYGLIGKIPSVSVGGKVAKVGAQSGLLSGITAAAGGDTEDIIISALIPVAFGAYSTAKGKISNYQMVKAWRQNLPFTRDIPMKSSLKYAQALREGFKLSKRKNFRQKGREYQQWHKRYGTSVDAFLKQADAAFVKAGGAKPKAPAQITGKPPTVTKETPTKPVPKETLREPSVIAKAEPTRPVTRKAAEVAPTTPEGKVLYHYTDTKITRGILKAGQPHEQNYFGEGIYLTEKGQFPGEYEYEVNIPKDIRILDLTNDKAYEDFRNQIAKEIGMSIERSGESLYDDFRRTAANATNESQTNEKIRKAIAKFTKDYDAIKAPYFGVTAEKDSFELVIKKKELQLTPAVKLEGKVKKPPKTPQIPKKGISIPPEELTQAQRRAALQKPTEKGVFDSVEAEKARAKAMKLADKTGSVHFIWPDTSGKFHISRKSPSAKTHPRFAGQYQPVGTTEAEAISEKPIEKIDTAKFYRQAKIEEAMTKGEMGEIEIEPELIDLGPAKERPDVSMLMKILDKKAFISEKGKIRPGARLLAKQFIGKTDIHKMTKAELVKFGQLINKLPEPRMVKGRLVPPSIPRTTALTKAGYFKRRFKRPTPVMFITDQSYYAEKLGVKSIVEPLEKAKVRFDLEYRSAAHELDKQGKLIDKIGKTTKRERIAAKTKNIPTKAREDMGNLLDSYEEAPANLDQEKKKIFNWFRKLTRTMLAKQNQVRAKLDIPLIKGRKAYMRRIATDTAREMLAGRYPFPEGIKFWSGLSSGKKIFNPMEFQRKLEEDVYGLFTKDPVYASKAMMYNALKEIHLTQPLKFFNAQMAVVGKDLPEYKSLSPEQKRQLQASVIPASTRRWLIDYVRTVIKGQQTQTDEWVNNLITQTGLKGLINKALHPFGRTVSQKPITHFFQTTGRMQMAGVIGTRPKLIIRNKFQLTHNLGLYTIKANAHAFLPPSSQLKKLLDESLFLKSYTGLEELPADLAKKIEKIWHKGYQWSAVSNARQAMECAYWDTLELIENPKYKNVGFADPARTYKEPHEYLYPSEKQKIIKEMEFGASATQFHYIAMGMPQVFRHKSLIPFTRLTSWWMNYFAKFHREAIHRGLGGNPSWDSNIKLPWSRRLGWLRYIILGGLILNTLGYTRSYLFGAAPTGWPPAIQFAGNLYLYLMTLGSDDEWQQSKNKLAKKRMLSALKTFVPGYIAYKDVEAIWSGRKDLSSLFFYKKWKKEEGVRKTYMERKQEGTRKKRFEREEKMLRG